MDEAADEDDWETKLEKGEVELPSTKETAAATEDSSSERIAVKGGFKAADKFQSFDDILCFGSKKTPVQKGGRQFISD